MKTNKLLAAGALALSMAMTPVASLINAMPVMAETVETTHTLTINNVVAGDSYTIYQIFTGKNNSAGNGNVLTDIAWGNGITDAGKKKIGGSTDDTVPTAADAANHLAELSDADTRTLAASLGTEDLTAGTTKTATDTSITFDDLASGYYLVKYAGTDGKPAEAILQVVNNVEMNAKTTSVPDYEKKVTENYKNVTDNPGVVPYGTNHKINDVADYNIGDEVPFSLAAKVPANLDNYANYKFTFQDTMDEGLTLNENTIKVYKVDENGAKTDITNADYVNIPTSSTTAHVFNVVIDVIKTTNGTRTVNVESGATVLVEFTATLNASAKPDAVGNENRFVLKYTNNPVTEGEGDTPEDEVVVFTYTLNVDKTQDDGVTALNGAKFILYRDNGDQKQYLKATGSAGVYKISGWTVNEEEATELEGNESANYQISGLDDGTYYLKETAVPDGYNTPNGDFEVVLSATTVNNQQYAGTPSTAVSYIKTTVKNREDNNIVNTKGAQLPETGGMGTTIIYGTGALLAVGAAVVYVTNKRTRKN